MPRVSQFRRVLSSAGRINRRIAEGISVASQLQDPLDVQMRVVDTLKKKAITHEETARLVEQVFTVIEPMGMNEFEIIDTPHVPIGVGSIVRAPGRYLYVVHALGERVRNQWGNMSVQLKCLSLMYLGMHPGSIAVNAQNRNINPHFNTIDMWTADDVTPVKVIVSEKKAKPFYITDDRGRLIGSFKNVPEHKPKMAGNYLIFGGQQFRVDIHQSIKMERNTDLHHSGLIMHSQNKIQQLHEKIKERRALQASVNGHFIYQLFNIIRTLNDENASRDHGTDVFQGNAVIMMQIVTDGWDAAMRIRGEFHAIPIYITDTEQFGREWLTPHILVPYRYKPSRLTNGNDVMPIPERVRSRLRKDVFIVFEFARSPRGLELHLRGLWKHSQRNNRMRYMPFPHYHWFRDGEMCWGSCPTNFNPSLSTETIHCETSAFKEYLLQLASALDTINNNSPTEARPAGLPRLDTIVNICRENDDGGGGWTRRLNEEENDREVHRREVGVNAATATPGAMAQVDSCFIENEDDTEPLPPGSDEEAAEETTALPTYVTGRPIRTTRRRVAQNNVRQQQLQESELIATTWTIPIADARWHVTTGGDTNDTGTRGYTGRDEERNGSERTEDSDEPDR
jgi:hypothetical protein